MNPDTDKYRKVDKAGDAPEGVPGDKEQVVESKPMKQMKCDEIQPMISAYLNKELSDAFFILVREHVRKCPNCKAVANEIQSTMAALKKADTAPQEIPIKLSEERKNKILQEVVGGHQYQWMYLVILIFTIVVCLWGGCNMIREIYDIGYKPIVVPDDEFPSARPGLPPSAGGAPTNTPVSNEATVNATTNTPERANP